MNGVEVQQSWPRKRGKKLDPKTLEQMEYFRQVQWAYKFSAALVQTSFRQAVHGTPLMPRDLFLMAASGRMHRVIDEQGRSWWSVAAIKNVSDALDVVAQLQGQMLVRRADRWGPIPVGSDGDVLTFNITTGMPEWAPSGAAATPHWGSILGSISDQADLEAALTAAAQSGQWGHISGSIAAQADLSAALDAVAITAEWGHISGSITDQADLEAALGTITANVAAAAITAEWGHISGSITDQADLEAALATAAARPWGGITGTLSAQTDLQAALDAKWKLTGDNIAVGNQTVTGYVSASEVRSSLIKGGATLDIRGDDTLIKSADGSTVYAEFNSAGGVINAGGAPVINITNTYVDYNIEIRRGGNRLWSRFIADPTGFSILQYEKPVTRPRSASFSWVNQNPAGTGGTTATDVANGIYIENFAPIGGVQARYLKPTAALPATFTMTTRSIAQTFLSSNGYMNMLILRNSTNGRCLVFGDFNNGQSITVDQWTSNTAFSSAPYRQNGACYAFPWRRITFDGVNVGFWVSGDGNQWQQIYTQTAATWILVGGGSIDEAGWGISVNATKLAALLQHFDIV